MIIEKKKIKDLKPAPYNPRISNERQEEKLKESLKKFGVVEPIIYNKQTGYIVGGHFRVRELIKLGYKEVECVIVDLNEEDEKELNIRLNANTGSWDNDVLLAEWDTSLLDNWGLEVFKPSNEDLSNFFSGGSTSSGGDSGNGDDIASHKIILEYTDEEYAQIMEAFNELPGTKEEIVYRLLLGTE